MNERSTILGGVRVLDGGLATELALRGANIDGPLWSAHVLEGAPEKIVAVHRAYLEAGADCILTASYQVSRIGYQAVGLTAEQADGALLKAVKLGRRAAAEFPERRVVVAASLGPYGAVLHNGAEYHGNYDLSFDDLVSFHRERIRVLAEAGKGGPDLLAFETLPSLQEAQAIGAALKDWPECAAWFCFTCKDERHVAHGEFLRDCAATVGSFPQTVAIGVNCTRPGLITALIGELRAATNKAVVVYPNSGEEWDAQARCWTGDRKPESYGALSAKWFAAGAQIVGGCCRTGPEHIRLVAALAPPRSN